MEEDTLCRLPNLKDKLFCTSGGPQTSMVGSCQGLWQHGRRADKTTRRQVQQTERSVGKVCTIHLHVCFTCLLSVDACNPLTEPQVQMWFVQTEITNIGAVGPQHQAQQQPPLSSCCRVQANNTPGLRGGSIGIPKQSVWRGRRRCHLTAPVCCLPGTPETAPQQQPQLRGKAAHSADLGCH